MRLQADACLTWLINILFTLLNIFHLAYLGAPFTSVEQVEGWSYRHTLDVWMGQWWLISHWLAIATVVISFLPSVP